MLTILIIIFLFIVHNIANGKQDGGNNLTERMYRAEIKKTKVNTPAMIVAKQELQKSNSRTWHLWGFITYGIVGIAVSFALWGFSNTWFLIATTLQLYLLRPLVFNPINNLSQGSKWLHLSNVKGSWDNWFRERIGEKGYYFSCLAFFLAMFYVYPLAGLLWTLIR